MSDSPEPESLLQDPEEEDPYGDVDLSEYPKWWRSNILTFREHGLHPYQPPRFSDGKLVPPIVEDLEDQFDITIQLRRHSSDEDDEMGVFVDGERKATVERRRKSGGCPQYELESDAFRALVAEQLTSSQ